MIAEKMARAICSGVASIFGIGFGGLPRPRLAVDSSTIPFSLPEARTLLPSTPEVNS
ncbi:MAG: hypothetical protein OXN84_21275 [Albidovulum sp.]|nr:hypothetical protein [Albidovulum sp.]